MSPARGNLGAEEYSETVPRAREKQMTTHDVELHGGSLADLERRHAEEVDRLRLLVEASATLLGSLRLEEVLPRVMALAKRTLAADAYAVWRRNRVSGRWSVARYDGLSAEYVELATAAVVSNTADVSLAEPVVAPYLPGLLIPRSKVRILHGPSQTGR